MTTTNTLPIETALPALRQALSRGHAIVQAPTGSGKSTRVPLALLDEPWLAGQRILMLEPRRAAARLSAARMAEVLGEALGETVGYQVRFERVIGARTRIEVLTEGILTRRLQHDPELDGVGLVIFDEFHERSLTLDLGLALALDTASGLREDLRLLPMSATLDAEVLSGLLGGAPVIRAEGRCYPVSIHTAERTPGADVVAEAARAVQHAVRAHPEGDVLVFLPGAGEIQRASTALQALTSEGIQILTLHGSLSSAEQDAALHPGAATVRRVILATDLAETSVTIPGVQVVIDTGLTRKPRFDPGSGLTRLVTEPIARASAEQRAGRAGRLAPGVCYRLWTSAQEHGRRAQRPPEIVQADLAPLVLEVALWGLSDPGQLEWLDPPPEAAWNQAVSLLQQLGVLTEQGKPTALGRAVAGLPLHPRLGVLLCAAPPEVRALAADLCALLSERDPWSGERGQHREADLSTRLHALEAWRARRASANVDPRRLASIARAAKQLRQVRRDEHAPELSNPHATDAAALLALAYPERIAQRRAGSDGRYLLASGTGAILPRDDALAIHPYLVVAALDGAGRDARIQLALPISESALREIAATRIHQAQQLFWDAEREALALRAITRLDALILDARPRTLDSLDATLSSEAHALLLAAIAERIERAFDWNDAVRQFQARLAFMRALEPEGGWPDLATETLQATLSEWLSPWLEGCTRLADTRRLDLLAMLRAQLEWTQQQRLDQEAPEMILTPAGNRRALDYLSGEVPVLALPIQEVFGQRDTPAIASGRCPLLLHLLSPARRPIQVTRDLGTFWAGAYAEVRKELRGRYPKHHWPEDPLTAQAVAGGVRRRRA